MMPYTIDGLRSRTYPGGKIRLEQVLASTETFTRYLISYPSDGLRITGVMQIPNTNKKPLPVIILNHGYVRRSEFVSGSGTWAIASYLNERGYVTVAPDYRSWGGSDTGPSFFHTGLVVDVINLVSSLPSLDFVDMGRIGILGHSMGGGVTTKVLTIDPRIRAGVLYSPNSSNDADIIDLWGYGCLPNQPRRWRRCNPGEVIPEDTPAEIIEAYIEAAVNNSALMERIAPIYHLDYIQVPLQVHVGALDTVTPPWWSINLYQALLNTGKQVDFFAYDDQGHLFEGSGWEVFLQRIGDFFDHTLDVL
jgi:dipeptidyl aminopeptidase/acylaminoacyl peptidase